MEEGRYVTYWGRRDDRLLGRQRLRYLLMLLLRLQMVLLLMLHLVLWLMQHPVRYRRHVLQKLNVFLIAYNIVWLWLWRRLRNRMMMMMGGSYLHIHWRRPNILRINIVDVLLMLNLAGSRRYRCHDIIGERRHIVIGLHVLRERLWHRCLLQCRGANWSGAYAP